MFHAAAYKHVPMMELNPVQAIANNALATAVLADLAERFAVERFCLISTDKAVEPKTVMGASKALAERVVEARAGVSGTRFAAVRFGNVLGSSGSVLDLPAPDRRGRARDGDAPRDDALLHDDPRGGPARHRGHRHRRGRRHLRARHGRAGADHGPRPSHHRAGGQDVAIEIVGIRPGEKLHEELFNVDEEVRPTRYGKIMRATRPPLDPAVLSDGIDEVARRIAAGRPESVAERLGPPCAAQGSPRRTAKRGWHRRPSPPPESP